MSISIERMQSYIPQNKLSIYSLVEEQNEARIYDKCYGLKEVSRENAKSYFEFLCQSARDLLTGYDVDRSQIKYLIVTHTAKMISPFGISLPAYLKKKLKLDNAIAFGHSITNCAGNLLIIDILNKILSLEAEDTKALIVSGDRAFTPYLQTIPRSTVLGEASTAILLSAKNQNHTLIATSFDIQGKYAAGSWLSSSLQIYFENNYSHFLTKVIKTAAQRAGVELSSIAMIIPHNVNTISWKNCMKQLNLGSQKIYLENVPKYGHCFGSDNFINLADAVLQRHLKKGDYYLMVTVGLGAIFVASVFQY
jgi:3-oxoacyl-[acyl-carrier-protein] synthase-3